MFHVDPKVVVCKANQEDGRERERENERAPERIVGFEMDLHQPTNHTGQ